MLVNCLFNLVASMYLALIALIGRFKGWHYPLVNFVNNGLVFNQRQDVAELIGFNVVKHHKLMRLLKWYKRPCVILLSFQKDHYRVNVYHLVKDKGETDLIIPTNSQPGNQGRFHYITHGGNLYHAKRPTTVTRKMGFFLSEPVMSFKIPMSQAQMNEVLGLIVEDAPHLNRYRVSITPELGYRRVTHTLQGDVVKSLIVPNPNFH